MAITTVNPTKAILHANGTETRSTPFEDVGRGDRHLEESVESRRISQARDLAAVLLVSPSSELVKQAWQVATRLSNLPQPADIEAASTLRSAISDLVNASVLAEEKLDLASKSLEESVFLDEGLKPIIRMQGRVGTIRAGSNALCLNPEEVQSLISEDEND